MVLQGMRITWHSFYLDQSNGIILFTNVKFMNEISQLIFFSPFYLSKLNLVL